MSHVIFNTKTRLLATALLLSSAAFGPLLHATDAAAAPAASKSAPAKASGKAAPAAKTTAPAPSSVDNDSGVKRVAADKMKMYTDAIANAKSKNAAIREQTTKLRQEVKNLMVAPTFDKAAFISKSAQIETLESQMHKNLTEATAAALTQFTPEERQILARGAKGADKAGKKGKKGGAGKAKRNGGDGGGGKGQKGGKRNDDNA